MARRYMQTAVDSENSLIVASDVVSDVNDTNQLENMVNNAAENLRLLFVLPTISKDSEILQKSQILWLK